MKLAVWILAGILVALLIAMTAFYFSRGYVPNDVMDFVDFLF
jgi:hypothetical protein